MIKLFGLFIHRDLGKSTVIKAASRSRVHMIAQEIRADHFFLILPAHLDPDKLEPFSEGLCHDHTHQDPVPRVSVINRNGIENTSRNPGMIDLRDHIGILIQIQRMDHLVLKHRASLRCFLLKQLLLEDRSQRFTIDASLYRKVHPGEIVQHMIGQLL